MAITPDTICAFATAPGRAGVAVLRLSGPRAGEVLLRLMRTSALPAPRQARLATLVDPHTHAPIDRGLVLWFPAPASFTGEDVAELHIHGGRGVMRALLEALCAWPGVRLAEPGEFTRRAFLSGKIDLLEAEAVADMIDAETRAQQRQAMRQLSGEMGDFYTALRARVLRALAHVEAYIDFPDEDIPSEIAAQMVAEIAVIANDIRVELGKARAAERVREGLSVVILGAPNAGKSSLMNAIARRDVAIVSHEAGTTRDVLEVALDIAGHAVTLMDTAGLRETAHHVESEGIRRALARAEAADIKLLLFDAAVLPAMDAATLAQLEVNQGESHQGGANQADAQSILVISRADLLADNGNENRNKILENIQKMMQTHGAASVAQNPVWLSAKRGEGVDALLAQIAHAIEVRTAGAENAMATQARHRQALEAALKHLEAYATQSAIELACEELRLAALAIGRVTGKIEVEQILDEIFRRFCIGK